MSFDVGPGRFHTPQERLRHHRFLWMDDLLRESRRALRALKRSPGFTLSVIITLALAIGVTTAILSAVEAVLLTPLPHVDLDRVVAIESEQVSERLAHLGLDPWSVFQLERRSDLFTAVAGYRVVNANLTAGSSTEPVSIGSTTGQFFTVFGVQPYMGRLYDTVDVRHGSANVVVLGFDFWRASTGGNPAVIGTPIIIDDSSYTVVGVLPRGFRFPAAAQLWTPKPLDPLLSRRAAATGPRAGLLLPAIARIKPGVSRIAVQHALDAATTEWTSDFPQFFAAVGSPILTMRSAVDLLAGPLHPIVLVLVGAVVLVLLAACANVASLQLVRATGRAREMALHTALGATRGRLLRHQAMESVMLALGGGAVGVAFGYVLVTVARRATAVQLADLQALRLDGFVIGAIVGILLLTAIVFGTAPALRALRIAPAEVLRAASTRNSSAGVGRNAFLRGAVVVQVALALVLMLGAGIAVLSFRHVLEVNPGFRAEGLITARVTLPASRYPLRNIGDEERRLAFHARLLYELRAVPGFTAVTTADAVPLSFANDVAASTHRLAVSSTIGPVTEHGMTPANFWSVDDSYFRTMGIPFRAGGPFSNAELETRIGNARTVPLSVVIDEPLARRLFPGESPIGKLIGPAAPGLRVVGVVAPTKQSDLAAGIDAAGTIYLPTAAFRTAMTIVVRSQLPFGKSASLLRERVKRVDPKLALFDVAPMAAVIDRSVEARELASHVLAGFGALTLILAALGVYGVLSYATAERVPEIGIRLAIGATPWNIAAMVVREGLTLVVLGLMIGLAVFLALGRLLAGLVYGMTAHNVSTIAGGVLALLIVATVATLVPARRAARVDPIDTLGAG